MRQAHTDPRHSGIPEAQARGPVERRARRWHRAARAALILLWMIGILAPTVQFAVAFAAPSRQVQLNVALFGLAIVGALVIRLQRWLTKRWQRHRSPAEEFRLCEVLELLGLPPYVSKASCLTIERRLLELHGLPPNWAGRSTGRGPTRRTAEWQISERRKALLVRTSKQRAQFRHDANGHRRRKLIWTVILWAQKASPYAALAAFAIYPVLGPILTWAATGLYNLAPADWTEEHTHLAAHYSYVADQLDAFIPQIRRAATAEELRGVGEDVVAVMISEHQVWCTYRGAHNALDDLRAQFA
jgi:hypothetical protein